MNDVAIKLTNISKYYRLYKSSKDRLKEALHPLKKEYHKKFYATNGINLEIKKGEILGIIGKNGSGKSTLLKLISGVLVPDTGNIKVNGKISALLELGSGFNPKFTGMENIFFYGLVLGFSKKKMEEKLDDIIAFAEIGEFIHQPLITYSSGMKSRLAFAVAVHIEPEILILDEVLSVGDILFKRKSYAKMEEFFKSGKTIIYVSHNASTVIKLCTRAIFLLDGKIVMDGDPKTVTKYYEKYHFAKKDNQEKIKNEIRNLTSNAEVPIEKAILKEEKKKEIEKQKPFLIKDFESKNRLEYDNTHLDIYDVFIKTMDGEKVNALVMHERYRYCYKLKFKKDFLDVFFSMRIHTDTSIVISGCGSDRPTSNQIIDLVNTGDILEVEWEFNCLMNEGIYYTNIGIRSKKDNDVKIINRIVDAFVFKVLPHETCCNGLVSLQQKAPIIKHTYK